ncbi:hypothetical protein Rhal01_03630 [Rubritalea halochordaticola]|uniref:DUF3137 domain-containing protein n=1 Tax=Rubritalea halochordaticola TaxID=714537 RepID=A0ABP9V7B5_9BACT
MSSSRSDVFSRAVANLNPLLSELEQMRLHSLDQRAKGTRYMWISALCCLPLLILGPFGLVLGGIVTAIACAVIYSRYFASFRKDYEQTFKYRVLTQLTKEVQPGLEYRPGEGLPQYVFEAAGLHSGDIDRYHTEDLFCGKIGDTDVWFAEVKAEDKRTRTDSKGNTETYWVTIFEGILFIADFHKHFASDVTVMPDVGEKHFGWLGKMMQNIGGNVVRLESPDFEREFVVRGRDQVEARYILTPDMQERILQLRSVLGGSLCMAFRNSKLHLSFENHGNWFEPDYFRPSGDFSQLAQFVREMQYCCGIVEQMNLNTRIWTKD